MKPMPVFSFKPAVGPLVPFRKFSHLCHSKKESNNEFDVCNLRSILSMRQKKENIIGNSDGKKTNKNIYLPKSENQQKYVDALNSRDVSLILSVGPAGTGKTLFACMYAIQELKNKNIKKIVLTRPVVTVDEEIGFLPGDINRKMDPWTRPIFDIFLEVFSQRELDLMIQNAVIEICPLAFMRGRTFKNSFILSDEMQNSTPNQMMMIATRIGDGSKMVITGDLRQSDRKDENGLNHFLNKIDTFEKKGGELKGVGVCMLENKDIERSPIVAQVLDIWSGNVVNTINNNTNNSTTKKNEHLFWIPPASNHSKSSLDAALIPADSLPKSFNGSICNL
jgi:phosphate starvation-inducible PhoH-like protein